MAKSSESSTKEPGRFRQIIDVVKMTAKYDKPGVALMITAAVLPILAAFFLCFFMYRTNWIMWVIFMILGVLFGLMLFMFVLNNRAEKVAYSQLEGRQGATGAVLQSSLRGTWRTSDMPVAFNPRTQARRDPVHRSRQRRLEEAARRRAPQGEARRSDRHRAPHSRGPGRRLARQAEA
jgi:hypothetical protein